MDVRLHRSSRSTQRLGYLIDPQSDHMAEDHGGPLVPVQTGKSPVPSRLVERFWIFEHPVNLRDEIRAPGAVPQMVPPQVEGNGPQPGLDPEGLYPRPVVARQRLVGADQRLLGQVLGFLVVAGQAPQPPIEASSHLLYHGWKCPIEILRQRCCQVTHRYKNPESPLLVASVATVPIVSAMEVSEIDQVLDRAEASVASGQGLAGTGFWQAVSTIKRDPTLVDRFAERVAAVDRAAFEAWAFLSLPVGFGTALLLLGLTLGLGLVGVAYYFEGLAAVLAFYIGFGALLVVTHGLGHLIVGRIFGIRFTHWFIGSFRRPQPGVKVDYASYLRTTPEKRAWMHAAGALTTKIVPFALVGAAIAAGLPGWSIWLLVGIGAGMIVTDILWSTKSSDWMRFRREMELAQP